MKQIKATAHSFLKKLFSDDGEISSKRVVGFGAFLLVVEIVQFAIFGKNVQEFIFFGLLSLIGACFGLNALIDISKNKTKKDESISESDN